MVLPLGRLPRYLILDPASTVRFEVRLVRPPCQIDVELENPRPGRSFLLLVGPQGGPLLQRMRITGKARILFEPNDRRPQVLMLANPQKEPLVLALRGRPAPRPAAPRTGRRRTGVRATVPRPAPSGRRPRLRWTEAEPPERARVEVVGPLGAPLRRARPKG